jgi:hypothetical protein
MLNNNHMPEFSFSHHIEPHLFSVLNHHWQITMKHHGFMDHRLYTGTKEI